MATIGNNMKWTMSSTQRGALRAFFEEGLGAKQVKASPELDAFSLGEGKQTIGVQYVAPEQALTAEQASTAPWLEFLLPDVGAGVARMDRLGLQRVDYFDREHVYFKLPGGLVFRLAAGN